MPHSPSSSSFSLFLFFFPLLLHLLTFRPLFFFPSPLCRHLRRTKTSIISDASSWQGPTASPLLSAGASVTPLYDCLVIYTHSRASSCLSAGASVTPLYDCLVIYTLSRASSCLSAGASIFTQMPDTAACRIAHPNPYPIPPLLTPSSFYHPSSIVCRQVWGPPHGGVRRAHPCDLRPQDPAGRRTVLPERGRGGRREGRGADGRAAQRTATHPLLRRHHHCLSQRHHQQWQWQAVFRHSSDAEPWVLPAAGASTR